VQFNAGQKNTHQNPTNVFLENSTIFYPDFSLSRIKTTKNKARKSAVVTALKFCYTFTFRKQKGFFAFEKKNKAN
jgi:hypothetical protein